MQKTIKTRFWALALVIGLLFTFQGVSAQSQTQPVFNIGILDDTRGAISNGARLAVQEINAAGGVRGADGTTFQLALVIETPTATSTIDQAVQALQAANVIAVLGPQADDSVTSGLTQFQSLNVPIITPATGDALITADSTGMLFRSRAADAVQGMALASYLISQYQLKPVATIQLDVASTASVVGFTTAASTLGVTPQPALILSDQNQMNDSVTTLVKADPAVIVAYGAPILAATLYNDLMSQGWKGLFAYDQAFDPIFSQSVPFDQPTNIVSVMTWPFTASDSASVTFLNSFIRAYGSLPGAVEAASYDSVKLIADALAKTGNLHDNLANITETPGVQGVLKANGLGAGDLSNNVAIVKMGDLGAPQVLARYQGNQLLPSTGTTLPSATFTPTPALTFTPTPIPPTATPEGVTLTVKQQLQNVRSGPGDNFDILGQLNMGDQASIIGASVDYAWVVINFRGTQGWLAAYLLTINGDLRSVPVVPSPPTPTPNFTATPSPSPFADLIIVNASISPNPVLANQNFTVNMTVGNIGGTPAGQFNVSGVFPPNNLNLIATVPGLAPGQTAALSLSGVLNGSGSFTTSLQIDPNNQVNEGPIGEQNNTYNISYTLGSASVPILRAASQTLNLGDTIDLEGNGAQGDANWNNDGGTLGLKAIFGAKLGILGNGDFNAVTYDQINTSIVNRDSVAKSELSVGTLIGIVTADGHRGVMQVTAVTDTQLGLNFKVWNG